MIPTEVLFAFFATALLLALAPGPDNLFVLTQSALKGPRAGLMVTLGLCTGLIFHTTAVAFGVAAIFQTSLVAFTTLKVAGALYLLYLAWQAFRATPSPIELKERSELALLPLYRRGVLMNITNPKVSMFFLAFLPQFTDPARGPLAPQIIILGLCFIAATLLVFGPISVLGGAIANLLCGSTKAQNIMNRIAGAVFAGLALKLAMSRR